MAKQEKLSDPAGSELEYKNKVVFLRKSKKGDHLFVFDSREDLISGGTLIMNVSEVERLIGGGTEWVKVSVLPPESAAEGSERAKEEG